MAMARSTGVAVAAVLVAALACTAFAGVSAITTKPSAGTAIIQTTLQVFPTREAKGQQQPSFAARYWQKQRDTVPSAATAYVGDEDDVDSAAPHKLSAAQQEHILEDIRRHNHQQQWWTAPGSAGTAAPSPTVNTEAIFHDGKDDRDQDPSPVNDQLQQLLQINDVAATDDDVTTVDSQDDDRHGKQRSIGNGAGSGGWQPQPSQSYGRPQQQQHPSLSPYVPPPPAVQQHSQHPQNQHQQQYYPTTSATVPHHHHHHQQQQQQKQQVFVTTPSSPSSSSSSSQSTQPSSAAPNGHRHSNQQYVQQLQYYPKQQQRPTAATTSGPISGPDGGELDPDIEQQIRQQLTAVVGAGGGNFTILTSPTGGQRTTQSARITGSASNDHLQYVQIGGGGVMPSAPSRNRVQQPQPTESGVPGSITANRNTVVKTVVVRQKPSPQPAAAAPPPVVTAPPAAAAKVASQQTWSVSEQQQLEQLARQVLPPGVAQYEIIRAGGIDGDGKNGVIGEPVAAATVGAPDDSAQVGGAPQQSVVGKKKPVTFVILEERPDGTVRVRGVEKKQHGVFDGGAPADGGDVAADQPGPVAADDEQLQQLVDRLNRGELRLPGAGPPAVSKTTAADSATAASTTAAPPLPAYVPTFASTASPPPKSNGGYGITKHRDSSSSSAYFSTVKPQTTSSPSTTQQQQQYQSFFLPTAVPTASVSVTTTVGQQNRYHHQQHQQQYHSTPAIATSASSSTPRPANSTLSYHNNNNNKSAKEGVFSGALRRRGYYAMAKYMRQAGVDSVLEETGPFTVFVPTDKAFRALLVQLGGPDRAEDKFRENPRLLIGLLLHHVVPGAFKAADLMAGDEMTGVSLAGTQLRANLYARQLYDNRWNDIEVLTVNGARVLDDVVPAASVTTDDGSSADDGGSVGPMQQRRDMVLSSSGDAGGLGGTGENQQIMAIAHAVDRVLFPLPVGDVLATMRADRQRRYSVFLRAVDEHCSSSVRSMLTGSRTLTVFAPMDEAFRVRRGSGNHTSSSGSIVDWLLREDAASRYKKRNRRRIADRFVLSHMVMAGPGDPPMYTAGLRFYQVRDTAYRLPDGVGESSAPADEEDEGTTTEDSNHENTDDGFTTVPPVDGEKPRFYQLTVYKDSGKIRLNGGAAQVLVRNVPATNGVLHGLDAPLV